MSPDLAQILGWAAVAAGAVAYQAKGRRGVILLLSLSCLLWCLHFIGLGAPAGAIFNGLALLRGVTALVDHPRARRGVLLFIPVVWVVSLVTAHQPIDYIPPVAMTMSTIAQASLRVLRLRLFMALSSPPWLVYAFSVGSHGGVANELLNMTSAGISLYRYHLRPWLASRRERASAL